MTLSGQSIKKDATLLNNLYPLCVNALDKWLKDCGSNYKNVTYGEYDEVDF
jgi:hypothetical protein